jgi:hypothetical protein
MPQVQEDWTWQTDETLQRSRNNVTELHRDEWTAFAKSPVAVHRLFSMTHLPARFVLYAYIGTTRTAEQASRRANAFQFDLQDGLVCDAGSTSTSSPARYVNTQPFHKHSLYNCEYKEYQGKLYLITLHSIAPMQELFVSYGNGKTPYAEWPQGFLGDGYQQVSQYRDYLQNIPKRATSTQQAHAKELLSYLKKDLYSEGLDEELQAATPCMDLLADFMTSCHTKKLLVLLEKVLTKCEIDLQSIPQAAVDALTDVVAKQQEARVKLQSLSSCKDLQQQCIKAMSAIQHAVQHLHAFQEAG